MIEELKKCIVVKIYEHGNLIDKEKLHFESDDDLDRIFSKIRKLSYAKDKLDFVSKFISIPKPERSFDIQAYIECETSISEYYVRLMLGTEA
jgi:hypothetical protein